MRNTMYTTLIQVAELAELLKRESLQAAQPVAVVLDCRHELSRPEWSDVAYAEGHIPTAQQAHLDRDLSSPITAASGRHPLPDVTKFAQTLSQWGIDNSVQVVAYDQGNGVYAARAWWLLRWLGHRAVAVLDGGLPAWVAAGGAVDAVVPSRREGAPPYPASVAPAMPTLDADAHAAQLGRVALVDARAGERFRGEVEPLDKQAGHIPGARHRFFKDNLGADGRFKSAQTLREEFTRLLGGTSPAEVVHQCGSGVTACHNLLAMEHAGLGTAMLYPGSWSEWSSDPARPIAVG